MKYEEVYLKAHDSIVEAKARLDTYVSLYNARQPHRTHGGRTLDQAHFGSLGDQTPLAA